MLSVVIWNKQNCLSNTAWGSWLSPVAPSMRGLHEFIIVAGKGGKFFKKPGEAHDWISSQFLEHTLEIWNFSPETSNQKHPAPFPIELPLRCIKLFSYKGDLILDPFLGSGTSCVAAKNLNCKSIGIEINPDYCEIAVKRLRQEVFDFNNVSLR